METFSLPQQTAHFGFHDKSSGHTRVTDNGKRATKRKPKLQYANGVVYSDSALNNGTVEFEVAITSYGTDWSGNIKIGVARFTSGYIIQPHNVPKYSTEASGHCVWSSKTLYNRLKSNRNGDQEREYGSIDLDSLREGDRLGLSLSHDGKLTFFVNGESQGLAAQGVYEEGYDVYAVVDLYGNCKAIAITRAGTVMKDMQWCRKVVKSGEGGNNSDYVLLVVPYTPRGVWGHSFLVFCCSETASGTILGKLLINSCFIDIRK